MSKFGILSAAISCAGLVAQAGAVTAAAPHLSALIGTTNPLWHEQKIRNYLPDMAWPEVRDLLTKSDMVVIPVGALEQHGPQGPIGTDYYNGTEEAELIAQQTDVLVAPILLPGNSPYHMGFPGTITLSTETLEKVYFEASQSLIQHGFRRFIFLNAHGGNAAMTRFVVDRINQETAATAVDLDQAMEPFLENSRMSSSVRSEMARIPDLKGFDHHAGVDETSQSLYLIPSLVDMSKAPPPHAVKLPPHLAAMLTKVDTEDRTTTLLFLSEALKAKSTGKGTSARDMTATGVWSELDPAQASASRGKATTDAYVDAAVRFIEDWKKQVPLNHSSLPGINSRQH